MTLLRMTIGNTNLSSHAPCLKSPRSQSMTTYATRSPLTLLTNPHIMNDARKSGRRTSDRLREKEDLPLPNGVGHGATKGAEKAAATEKSTKANGNETAATGRKTREKRKLGMSRWRMRAFRVMPLRADCILLR